MWPRHPLYAAVHNMYGLHDEGATDELIQGCGALTIGPHDGCSPGYLNAPHAQEWAVTLQQTHFSWLPHIEDTSSVEGCHCCETAAEAPSNMHCSIAHWAEPGVESTCLAQVPAVWCNAPVPLSVWAAIFRPGGFDLEARSGRPQAQPPGAIPAGYARPGDPAGPFR